MEVPSKAVVNLYGIPYEVDLVRCRVAMLKRLEEFRAAGKEGTGRELIAEAADVAPATVARLLKGKQDIAPESFVAIVTKGFGLEVADVAKPVDTSAQVAV